MDGKKKRNKKKKGNQAKQIDSISTMEDINHTISDDSVSNIVVMSDYDHDIASEMNHYSKAPSSALSQNFGVSEPEFEEERHNVEANCGELQENKIEVKRNIWSQKECDLEERIRLLQYELGSCVQIEANLVNKINDLQAEDVSLLLREDDLEERIKRVEGMSQSIVLEESSIKDVVSNLGEAIEGLQMQVMELKEARDNLDEENKQLTERTSVLESRMQQLETIASFYDSSKASEIHVQPFQYSKNSEIQEAANDASPLKSDHASVSQEKVPESNESIQTLSAALEIFRVDGHDDFSSDDQSRQTQMLRSVGSRISEDAVSVPLDDVIQVSLPATAEMVPISDAPLIGAPFRLLSFVTRYVSGADLIDPPKSGR